MKTTKSLFDQTVEKWVLELLSTPSEAFGDLPPCPYAKKAWKEDNVIVKKFVDYNQFEKDIENVDERVMIFYFDYPQLPSLKMLVNIVSMYKKRRPDLIFYDEHPDSVEEVAGVRLNSGMTAIIVQDRKDLLRKRAELQKTGYYDNWTPKMKEKIFGS